MRHIASNFGMRKAAAIAAFLLVSCAVAQKPATPKSPPPELRPDLLAEWNTTPQLSGNGNEVKGSVVVVNGSDDDYDQTVLVEAVNEIGKAFAIGYQHFTLEHRTRSVPIRFDTTLPPGRYLVHADAVAEVASRHLVHRTHLVGPFPLVVTVI